MAKRKRSPKREEGEERVPRPKTPQSAESLDNISQSLIAMAGRLKAVATDLKGANFEKLQVKNYHSLLLGKKYVNNFVAACIRALDEAQQMRGDFAADKSSSANGQAASQ